jgi:hypothetical protein
MAAASLGAEGLESVTRVRLDPWLVRTLEVTRALGEIGYLGLLVLLAALMLPVDGSTRSRIARATAFFLLPVALGAFYLAERQLGAKAFTVVLYHAQRVHLFVDTWPWPRVYAVPLALVTSCAFAGVLSGAYRGQAAGAAVLLVASGYAPHALGRLLTSTLGVVLCARVALAQAGRADAASAVERRDRASDAVARPIDDVRSDGVAEP